MSSRDPPASGPSAWITERTTEGDFLHGYGGAGGTPTRAPMFVQQALRTQLSPQPGESFFFFPQRLNELSGQRDDNIFSLMKGTVSQRHLGQGSVSRACFLVSLPLSDKGDALLQWT